MPLRAGALYFCLVFVVGYPIRELLILLLAAEVAGARWLRGQPIRDYLAGFVSIPGGAALLLFLVFAAMPAIVMRCEACGARSSAPRRSG